MESESIIPECETKPFRSPEELVQKLEEKGVSFEKNFSKEDAISYLRQNNNYYKLSSYRKNFPKDAEGKYVGLDFAALVELAIIDMMLRHIIVRMALDIEHFEKVKLLNVLKIKGDDGYTTLEKYKESLKQLDETELKNRNKTFHYDRLMREIEQNQKSTYCKDMINHIKPGQKMPVWVFTEVITFGTFRHFLGYCSGIFADKTLNNDFHQLYRVKALRNAAGHNNCILNDLSLRDGTQDINRKVLNKFRKLILPIQSHHPHNEPDAIQNDRIKDLITLFYMHSTILPSNDMRKHYRSDLNKLVEKMNRHKIDYFSSSDAVMNAFSIIEKIVDEWY